MVVRYKRFFTHAVVYATIVVHTFSLGLLWFMSENEPRYVNAEPVTLNHQVQNEKAITGIPVQIVVPSLNINLIVEPGTYDATADSWTLSGYNAHFATMTPPANDTSGNTFIYGHNNPYVFGPLKRIQPGANVEIVTDNGNRFYYTYQESYTVAPNDVSLFKYYGSPILTVQTCTGTWNEKRELYEFRLDRVVESSEQLAQKESDRRNMLIKAISSQMPAMQQGQVPTLRQSI